MYGTLIRIVVFIFAWLNSYLVSKGLPTLPVVDEEMVAWIVTFVVSVWTLVKDNRFKDLFKKTKEEQK